MRKFERDADGKIVCDDNPGVWLADAMRRPDNFGYFGEDRDSMFVTWALGPVIKHRDSPVIDRANARALRKFLESDSSLDEEYRFTECNHWAVGHVTHISFHAYDSDDNRTKRPTRIARILAAWFQYLDEMYPIADEDLMGEVEQEEADETWLNCYSAHERIAYIRVHRSQFDFHSFTDLLGCVRGKYFGGYASELLG